MLYEMRHLLSSLLLKAFNHYCQFLLRIKYHICKAYSGEQVILKKTTKETGVVVVVVVVTVTY
jgi:hypothetical protein